MQRPIIPVCLSSSAHDSQVIATPLISRNEKPYASHGKSRNSGTLCSTPSPAFPSPAPYFRPPNSRSNAKTRNRLRSALPCFAELPCISALAFSQLVTNNLTGSLRYFSSAPAHSPDRLQRSLNPFAHSRETVACFAVTGKQASWHRTKRAILLFHSSPALFFSRPQIQLYRY